MLVNGPYLKPKEKTMRLEQFVTLKPSAVYKKKTSKGEMIWILQAINERKDEVGNPFNTITEIRKIPGNHVQALRDRFGEEVKLQVTVWSPPGSPKTFYDYVERESRGDKETPPTEIPF
jgi:hypothetical protein